MRAMLCHETGSIDGLVPGEVPDPVPGPGQIAVDVHAAGLNFGDALMVEGSYQEKPALPFAPGMEVAGVVRALGPGVDHFAVGDRVLAMPGHGGYAEIAVAEASAAARIPDAMPFETAAGFAVTYCTAHGALVWRGRLRSGELLMVHAAAGGVGLATVEVGKALGAEVIATAGGPEKLAIAADHGADHLIDYTAEDIRARVKDIAEARGQRGADVIFDPVGGDVFDVSLRSINFEGRIVVIGFAGGRVPQAPANIVLVKNIDIVGFVWGAYRRQFPDRFQQQLDELFAMYGAGQLRPHVSYVLPLDQAAAALHILTGRKSTGKVVLKVRD